MFLPLVVESITSLLTFGWAWCICCLRCGVREDFVRWLRRHKGALARANLPVSLLKPFEGRG